MSKPEDYRDDLRRRVDEYCQQHDLSWWKFARMHGFHLQKLTSLLTKRGDAKAAYIGRIEAALNTEKIYIPESFRRSELAPTHDYRDKLKCLVQEHCKMHGISVSRFCKDNNFQQSTILNLLAKRRHVGHEFLERLIRVIGFEMIYVPSETSNLLS